MIAETHSTWQKIPKQISSELEKVSILHSLY